MALRDLATRKRFVKFSNATGWPLSNAMLGLKHQSVGRPREAVLGLPSRNCTPRRGVGSAFRARRLMSLHPRAKAPDFAKPTSRLAFRRHLPQHEGRHSFSDGGLGYSVRPLRGHCSLDISGRQKAGEIRKFSLVEIFAKSGRLAAKEALLRKSSQENKINYPVKGIGRLVDRR